MNTLEDRLQRLPRERQPAQDLWPAIAARLDPPARRWTLPRVAAAAGVFLVAAVALRLGSQPPVTASGGGNLAVLSASVELEYSGALRDLRQTISALDQVSGDGLMQSYRDSLAVVHQATEQVRAALKDDPDSRLLNDMLADLQKKQLGVLREMALSAPHEWRTTT